MSAQLMLGWTDWLQLFSHFLILSLLAVGGAITTSPDMHRYLVEEQHWLTATQFNTSITLAQAAPGPNVLFIALMGWHVGLNAGGYGYAMLGVALTMLGIMLPSSILTFVAARWSHENRDLRAVRAFKQGLVPLVIALLISTSWLLTVAHDDPAQDWRLWLLTLVSALVMWRTKVHILWLLGAGALLGWLGWV
jgi:chromate transporter